MSGSVFLVLRVILIIIGAIIGKSKGRLGEGIAWSAFLGLIGVIIIACRRPAANMQVVNSPMLDTFDQPAEESDDQPPRGALAGGERVLNEFYVPHGGTYYDGQGHSLGNMSCTLTSSCLTISEDIRGRTFRIPLSNITSIEPHGGLNKYLDIKMGSFATMRIYGKRYGELSAIADMINHAIGSQFS